jgi:uncharacterized membrane protein
MFSKAEAEAYFLEEKQWAMVVIVVGLLSILLAIVFYFLLRSVMAKGASLPLLGFGLLFFIAGYHVYNRSDKQRTAIVYNMDMNPEALANKEVPRMKGVMKRFVWLRYTEWVLLAACGCALFFLKDDPDKKWLKGLALGILVQVAIALLVDTMAERRASKYFTGLQHWLRSAR